MNDAWSDTEKRDRVGDLRRLADAAERRALREPRLRRRVEHRRLDGPGEHGVDPDSRRRELGGGDLGETSQRPLR